MREREKEKKERNENDKLAQSNWGKKLKIESFFFLLRRIYFWFCSISIDTHTRSSYKDLTHTDTHTYRSISSIKG